MRILHIATRHRRGGAERNLVATIRWEVAHGHVVHLAVGRDSLPEAFPPDITVHVVPHLVRAISPLNDARAFSALRRLIRDGAYDLVHSHQSKAGVIGRAAARGLAPRIVHTVHMASFGDAYNPVASVAFRMAERYCASFTTRIVSVGTELVTMYVKAGIGRSDQYSVIRSPIELEDFELVRQATPDERADARRSARLREGVPVALVVASLESRKRVDVVIRELAPLMSSGRLQLLVAGDGPQRSSLEHLAQHLGVGPHVWFAGHVAEPSRLMRAAEMLVHAATVEGVPQVVLQAFAAGLDVVATEMIGLREIPEAPVVIGSRSGRDLATDVARVLAEPIGPLPLERLRPWSTEAIDSSRAGLFEALMEQPPR